ncbi:MAG: STAS domain-containing protein [candidate division KSB1 bacterium]|nr:STAS domain-containing protein [candidate division KSB1 bacterium]MDZ7303104.1 STAS domain-containing protein [candidate division KSB1 bacterium]MDZ7312643.1 STAS domain-containing protein [candidate division KSB1 bacterium]
MEFTEETFGSVKVFHLHGKIMGGPGSQPLCDRLKELAPIGRQELVMDFQNVRWINSLGIGVIISCLTTLRHSGGDLRFANLHDATAHYFHLTKLETVVKIFDSVDAAVASFAQA